MKRRMAALLLAGTVLLSACGGSGSAPSPGGQQSGSGASNLVALTIATMSPLSGSSADLGNSIKNGAELALNDRASDLEKAGFKITLLPMDDQGKPEQGTQLAEQLITKKDVIAMVGTLNSGVVIPVSQKLSSENLAIVSPANTATQVTDRGLPNMNRIVARDDQQGPAALKFIKETLKAESVFVIHDKTPYGQGLADEVKKSAEAAGVKVDAFEGINVGEKDFSAVLNKVKAANSKAIFFGGLYAEAAQILKQMQEKGISAAFIGADGIDSSELANLAGSAADGVYYTSVAADPNKTPEGQAWAKRYQEFAKKTPDGFSIYSYDAMQVVVEALIKYGTANPGKTPTRKEIADLIRQTNGFKGVSARVSFDEKGDNKEAEVFLFKIENGKYPGVQQ